MDFDEEKWLLGEGQYYEFKILYQPEKFIGKKIELNDLIFAISKYGGIMASIPTLNKIIISSQLTKGIFFFTCDGFLYENIEFSSNNQLKLIFEERQKKEIKCFDFFDNEELFLLFSDYSYFIINPNNKNDQITVRKLAVRQENIHQAKVCQNGFSYCTFQNNHQIKFYYIQNAYNPDKECLFKIPFLKELPRDWIFLSSQQSNLKSSEFQITHPVCGIISLSEQSEQIYYNNINVSQKKIQLPNIKNICLIDISPNNQLIAYLEKTIENFVLHILSNDYEASSYLQIPVDIGFSELKDLQLIWCGNDCCVIKFNEGIILVESKDQERIKINDFFILSKEIDGIKIITKKQIRFLRKIPECHLNVFNDFSSKPGYKLYQNYINISNRIPVEDQDLRNSKEQLKEAVLDCINSALFVLNEDDQKDLLKAASYGKTYLDYNAFDHNLFPYILKIIRITYNMNRQKIKRMITYKKKVKYLLKNQEKLFNILLTYNYHQLAIDICQDSQIRIKILIHWAKQLIEINQQSSTSDEVTAQKIIQQVKSQQKLLANNKLSYIDIVEKAIQCGKDKLALILLEQEPQMKKKFLFYQKWVKNRAKQQNTKIYLNYKKKKDLKKSIEYFEKALNQSLISKNSDLIYRTILKIDECLLEENLKFRIFYQKPELENHFKNILRLRLYECQNDNERIQSIYNYFDKTNQYQEKGNYLVQQSIFQSTKNLQLDTQLKYEQLQEAEKAYKNTNDENRLFNLQCVQDQININHFYYNEIMNKQPVSETQNVNNIIKKVSETKNQDVKQLQKLYKLSDKRLYLLKIRSLFEKKEYDQIELYLKQINKKKVIIPYEIVADIFIKNDQKYFAIKLIQNIQDLEEQINLLIEIDEPKKAIAAVVHSGNKKSFELLEYIKTKILDPNILQEINQQQQQQMLKK
ncbi:hypothetical protein IMG5_026090 [Ichthyophthirius multifiliis]|uniref:Uncharacterized protein n=1 Tax=Ichthyophthirius multifiliis TaxID=5932 RepID=G0QL63_ICHMU|nr:hypothetical protein IMG5_026090 [Ichthyophthirius multifiliis]EGR34044.1 hypothetical protein IMG5_026090 [Ichthyophthirius multifiliis]|eukprot:XP_004039348.1 hypothetical protein IMG5_026090 [Ichthyophthirius multifiliis]